MNMSLITEIENRYIKNNLPPFASGDTVKVNVRVTEGTRERIQAFDGVVIAINGSGINKSITVRKISFGIGVERIFPVHAPIIGSIEILRKGKVRRAKLYYLRDRIGKSAKIKEDR
jgi:large subunit ribosomal protein L19